MDIVEIIFIFISSITFSIIFNLPARTLIYGGINSVLGWIVFRYSFNLGISPSMAIFFASTSIALFGEIMARIIKQPVTIFIIPGIIPLVPGGTAYETMLAFVKGDYNLGLSYGAETVFAAGSIAAGLAFLTISFRLLKNIKT
jgi:uncharacterized membrane protein YjjB (DUF3815 family)